MTGPELHPAARHTGAPHATDLDIRLAAFEWLHVQVSLYGEVLPRPLLTQGFRLKNHRVPLLGPQGIWKPRLLPQYPLSITTTPNGPYNGSSGSDDSNAFAYRGTDPEHRDNVGLRAALTHQVPLVYFHGLMPGKYVAAWPVYVVGLTESRMEPLPGFWLASAPLFANYGSCRARVSSSGSPVSGGVAGGGGVRSRVDSRLRIRAPDGEFTGAPAGRICRKRKETPSGVSFPVKVWRRCGSRRRTNGNNSPVSLNHLRAT